MYEFAVTAKDAILASPEKPTGAVSQRKIEAG
jgi:hypothetical protein